jgi:hypothetical protein
MILYALCIIILLIILSTKPKICHTKEFGQLYKLVPPQIPDIYKKMPKPFFASISNVPDVNPLSDFVIKDPEMQFKDRTFQLTVPRDSVITDEKLGTAYVLVPVTKILSDEKNMTLSVSVDNSAIDIILPKSAVKKINNSNVRISVPIKLLSIVDSNTIRVEIPQVESFASSPSKESEPNYCNF